MKDSVDRVARPGARRKISPAPPGTASPTGLASPTEDRGLMPEESSRVTETICSSCSRDLGAPDLNYRLVLRCTSIGRA